LAGRLFHRWACNARHRDNHSPESSNFLNRCHVAIFTDAERDVLNEMRALSTDSEGREILVGLTIEETVFCMEYVRNRMQGHNDSQNGARYLELHEKHECARFAVLGAEHYIRTENPPIQ